MNALHPHDNESTTAVAASASGDDTTTTDFLSKLTLESPQPKKRVTLGQRMMMMTAMLPYNQSRRKLTPPLSSPPWSPRKGKNPAKDKLSLSSSLHTGHHHDLQAPKAPLRRSHSTRQVLSLSSPTTKKLLLSPPSPSWGHDSHTETTLNCSMASLMSSWDDYDVAAQAVRRDLDANVAAVTADKATADQAATSHLQMARARLSSGCTVGAALSMRKVHTAQTQKAYLAAAQWQLTMLRQQIVVNTATSNSSSNGNGNGHNSNTNTNLTPDQRMAHLDLFRARASDILAQARAAKAPTPSDAALLQQLHRIVDLDDSDDDIPNDSSSSGDTTNTVQS